MSSPTAAAPLHDFVAELFQGAQPRRSLRNVAWAIALGAHAALLTFALQPERAKAASATALEVELTPPEPPEPPPLPVAAPEPATPAHQLAAAKPAAAPPEPARAGALLTAKADPEPSPNADEPVDFTNDPNALGFGAGVVAVGGKARVGLTHAQLGGVPAAKPGTGVGARPVGEALTPLADLSRRPSLAEGDPCRGYFPSAAADDVATASVMVTIAGNGAVSNVQLVSESPAGQGFGGAAKSCMASKHFSPGLDRDGKPARTAMRVNIRFTR